MFEYMGDRLSNAIKNIKGMGKITEDNISDAIKEIRMALLEADVNYEVVKELNKKPIMIKVLNTRVDTARDLVLKLYNTTTDMIKTAQLAEMAIVYGNRYRSEMIEIDRGLDNAEMLYHKGDYKDALDVSLSSIELIEADIHKKLLDLYQES